MLNTAKSKSVLALILFITVLGLNLHLRLYPAYFPQLKEQAKSIVKRDIAMNVLSELNRTSPDFNPIIKNKIINEAIDQAKNDKQLFKGQVEQRYRQLKDPYQNENKRTYLLEVDPYAWMRFTRLTLLNGYPGNKLVNNTAYDTFMLAPVGAKVNTSAFLFYSSAFLYRVANLFLPGLTLETFLFYLPLLHCLLFFIATYLFCRYYFSSLAGTWAIFFIGLAPIFLQRSTVGWFDSDILSLLLPLLVIWFLALSMSSERLLKKGFFCLLASFFLALFAWTWVGWWFIFLIVNIFFFYMFINNIFIHFQDKSKILKNFYHIAVVYLIFSIGSVIFCKLLAGIEPFSSTYGNIADNLGFGRAVKNSIWPNVYYTVRELQPGSVFGIVKHFGKIHIFIFAALSAFLIFMKEKRSKNAAIVLLLTFWMFFMFLISLKARRFSLFLVIPFGIFLGAGLDMFFKLIFLKIIQARDKAHRIMFTLGMIILIFITISPSYSYGRNYIYGSAPLINDHWYKFLKDIKQATPENSIVNAWWDYGNWIKEVANRKVLFDPQSQDRPLAYWLARAILTDDEGEALRILRMLNNSSDKLFDKINRYFNDDFKSVALLSKILKADRDEAEVILGQYSLPEDLRQEIIDCIFLKKPPPGYLVIDESILPKISTLSFIANWNFSKVYIMENIREPKEQLIEEIEELFSLSAKEAELFYDEVKLSLSRNEPNEFVSSRFSVFRLPSEGEAQQGKIFFNNGMIFEEDTHRGMSLAPGSTRYSNYSFSYLFDGQDLTFAHNKEVDVPLGGLFIKEGSNWQALEFLPKELAQSLFFRLYFMKAKGLRNFEPFLIDEEAKIYAFKIIW